MLSKRLEAIIDMIHPTDVLIDIGTDHALLLIELVKRNIINKGIGIDNKLGPLSIAKSNVIRANLENEIKLIEADGAKGVKDLADTWVIAGIGGENTLEIIEQSIDKASKLSQLILSPHSKPEHVRKVMGMWGFNLMEENLINDEKYYWILAYQYDGLIRKISLKEQLIGQQKNDSYVNHLIDHYSHILKSQTSKDKSIIQMIETLNREL